MTAHARPCYEDSLFRSVYLGLTPYPSTHPAGYRVHTQRQRPPPGLPRNPLFLLITTYPRAGLIPFYVRPAVDGRYRISAPLPLALDSSPTARRLSPFLSTSLVSQSFSLVVTSALQYPSSLPFQFLITKRTSTSQLLLSHH